jgi:GNAT superfamily N-acetyltransferase
MELPDTSAAGLSCVELGTDDAPALQAFFEANPLYFEAVDGQPPQPGEGLAEITDRPPEGMVWRRAWALGFLDAGGQIAAMAGVIADLMAEGTWHVGIFIVATARHGSGEAHAIYRAIEDWARANGARWMRLGVVVGNARAERFWLRCGFVELRQREGLKMGRLTQTVRVMLKPLTELPIESYLALVERDRPESTAP